MYEAVLVIMFSSGFRETVEAFEPTYVIIILEVVVSVVGVSVVVSIGVGVECRVTCTVKCMDNANPRQSKPGPILAADALLWKHIRSNFQPAMGRILTILNVRQMHSNSRYSDNERRPQTCFIHVRFRISIRETSLLIPGHCFCSITS